MEIKNLTPHSVVILRDDAEGAVTGFTGVGPSTKEGRFSVVTEIAPEGPVARARQTDEVVGMLEINGVEVSLVRTVFGATGDLPQFDGTTKKYVVSVITAQAAKATGRDTSDLLVPSDPVRDANGRIIGVRKFALI